MQILLKFCSCLVFFLLTSCVCVVFFFNLDDLFYFSNINFNLFPIVFSKHFHVIKLFMFFLCFYILLLNYYILLSYSTSLNQFFIIPLI